MEIKTNYCFGKTSLNKIVSRDQEGRTCHLWTNKVMHWSPVYSRRGRTSRYNLYFLHDFSLILVNSSWSSCGPSLLEIKECVLCHGDRSSLLYFFTFNFVILQVLVPFYGEIFMWKGNNILNFQYMRLCPHKGLSGYVVDNILTFSSETKSQEVKVI